jgi:hypothetical protein
MLLVVEQCPLANIQPRVKIGRKAGVVDRAVSNVCIRHSANASSIAGLDSRDPHWFEILVFFSNPQPLIQFGCES